LGEGRQREVVGEGVEGDHPGEEPEGHVRRPPGAHRKRGGEGSGCGFRCVTGWFCTRIDALRLSDFFL